MCVCVCVCVCVYIYVYIYICMCVQFNSVFPAVFLQFISPIIFAITSTAHFLPNTTDITLISSMKADFMTTSRPGDGSK